MTNRLAEELSEAMEAIEEEFELDDLKTVIPRIVIDLEEESFQFVTKGGEPDAQ